MYAYVVMKYSSNLRQLRKGESTPFEGSVGLLASCHYGVAHSDARFQILSRLGGHDKLPSKVF